MILHSNANYKQIKGNNDVKSSHATDILKAPGLCVCGGTIIRHVFDKPDKRLPVDAKLKYSSRENNLNGVCKQWSKTDVNYK